MSYIHCPDCMRAYNLVGSPACPHCGVRAGAPEDPTDDIIVAADQLARAVARATPAQLAAAEIKLLMRSTQLALPSPDRPDFSAPPSMLRAVRSALLLPAPETEPRRKRDRFAAAATALLARLPSPRVLASQATAWSTRARAMLPTW
ncbi:MAG: hypothetical protein H0V17_17600 [Deltaproteobacteria bacterium]|nr:hypothetical protein [Deltaproteobacteria bacterium]